MIMYDHPPAPIYRCVDCTANEQEALVYLQKSRGITDKNALATVMGNIKQESKFIPNICEGGARVPYKECYTGGYGIIQWTSTNRYNGLGLFTSKYGGDPSSFKTQLHYMVNEPQWTKYELVLKGRGQTINYYMDHAWYWLGWGIHGNRTKYAFQYLDKFVLA